MPFFKDPAGAIHFLDDACFSHLLPSGSVEITDVEAAELQKPSAEHSKCAKWEAIKAERDRRTEAGGYKVGGKWFHSDSRSRSQQQDNEAAGAALVSCDWKTMDGSFVTMTPELAAQIRDARMASDREIFAAAQAHKLAMEASADPASYDFSDGWPEVFDS